MTTPTPTRAIRPSAVAQAAGPRQMYFELRDNPQAPAACTFLHGQLASISHPCQLPTTLPLLSDWLSNRSQYEEAEYASYRAARNAGAPRRHFATRQHALEFLQRAAPSLMVQGAWLYGLLPHWELDELGPLVALYLSYVGHGIPDANRVVHTRRMLQNEEWERQDQEFFLQGAIRLALGCSGSALLPEVIGYQLGVDGQACANRIVLEEIRELGAAPGLRPPPPGATAALATLQALLPAVQDQDSFMRRVLQGYQLASVGSEAFEDMLGAAEGNPAAIAPATPLAPETAAPILPMPNRSEEHAPRSVIRHEFLQDEHAWEAIVNDLGLLEAQVASSASKEEAMALLCAHMAPGQHHQPAGLMACRVFSQLYTLG